VKGAGSVVAIAALLATSALAEVALPDWAMHVLAPGERPVHVLDYGKQGFNDGNPAFIVAAGSAGDSLGGRVITTWLDGESVEFSVDGAWVASALSGPLGYVRVFDSVAFADARAAIEAVRELLRANEYV
jgi:hypothetical protein